MTNEPILQLEERVRYASRAGESHFREFKSAWQGERSQARPRALGAVCRDVAEALVAFANADGGELLIGVDDDGGLTGVVDDAEFIDAVLRAPESHVHPDTPLNPLKAKVTLDEMLILYFQVDKSSRFIHLTADGRCVQRRDRATVPAAPEQIRFERQEQISREYDRGFVEGANLADLDTALLEKVAEQLAGEMSAEKCLQMLNLAEYASGVLRIRRAALLLFASDVSHWHPRCEVRIVRVKGTEVKTAPEYNVQNFGTARGNIVTLFSKAWEILRSPGLLVETKFSAGGIFEERIMYPEDAVREALVNAIAHRDYSIEGRGIEVIVFDDRMEVHSPGAPVSTVSLQDLRKLKGIHESRNAFLARTLRELGYMREMGEGIRRIYYLMRVHDLVPPDIDADEETFNMTLHHESVFSEADQRWIDSFEAFNLTKEEKLVVLLGRSGALLSPQQIWDTVDLVDTEVYRSIVHGLQIKGILITEVPKGRAIQEAKRDRVSVRSVGRFRIRTPQECEADLARLLGILRTADPRIGLSPAHLQEALRSLPETSPFRSQGTGGVAPVTAALKSLGLLDDNRRPAGRLLAMMSSSATGVSSTAPVERVGSQLRGVPQPVRAPRNVDVGAAGLSTQLSPRDIFVGNLEYSTTPGELEELFRQHGHVARVTVPRDYLTGKGRGFGFITMPHMEDASTAISELDGTFLRGRPLQVGWSLKET